MSDEQLTNLWNKKYISKKDIKDIDYSFLPEEIKNFLPRQIVWHLINKVYDVVRCYCGEPVNWSKKDKSYRKYCSSKCSSQDEMVKEKRKRTNLKKYGVEHSLQSEKVKEKLKKTNLERYGVENPFQNNFIQEKSKQTNLEKYGVENPFGNKEIQEKIKQTNLERYGVENPSQNNIIQEKRKRTIMERYGVEYPFNSIIIQEKIRQTNLEKYGTEKTFDNKEIQKKIRQTNLEKYGTEIPFGNNEIQEKIKQTNLERYGTENPFGNDEIQKKIKQTNMEKYGTPFPCQTHLPQTTIEILNNKEKFSKFIRGKSSYEIYDYLGIHQTCFQKLVKKYNVQDLYKRRGPSYLEIEMSRFLDDLNIKYDKNNRTILNGKELDFYIPEYNIAIEMNGIYWHSDKHILDNNYHFNKWKLCFDSGIHLISIFEDDWINQNKKIKNMLKYYFDINKETIYEKLFYINQIESPVAQEFLDKYHLKGFVEGNHFGAFDKENKLLAVMTINNKTDNVFVLERFVNKQYDYTNLFSELLDYARKYLNINKIISYSDNTFFKGDEYVNNGFKLNRIQNPEYSYVFKDKRVNKNSITENYLKTLFPQLTKNIKNDINEHTIMKSLDIPKIYDCGSCEWLWKTQEK